MRVVVFGSEALAIEMEGMLKSGIEVVVLGAPIDSPKIESLLYVVNTSQYVGTEVMQSIVAAGSRLAKGTLVKVLVV